MSRYQDYLQDLRTLPADAMLAYRHEGARGAWKTFAARTLHRMFRAGRTVVFAQSLDGWIDVAPPAGVRITQATEGDWVALTELVGQRELSRFRKLLDNGRHCLVAWRGDAPVGCAWVAAEIGPDVILWPFPLEFPKGAAYLWNLYVVPSERSSGIGSALAAARLQLAREAGFREGWRMVSPSNGASLRTVQKSATDTRVVGEVRFVQLLSRTYAWFTPHPTPAGIN